MTTENSQLNGVIRIFNKDVPNVIGLPPSYIYEAAGGLGHDYLVLSGIPIMSIQPALPIPAKEPDEGMALQLFDMGFKEGWDRYNEILGTLYGQGSGAKTAYSGLQKLRSTTTGNILVAFMNDASISESFTSEYSESRFEGIGGFSNDILSELRYITGSKGVGESISKIAPKGWLEEESRGIGIGKTIGSAANVAGWTTKKMGEIGELVVGGGAGYTKILSGSKIDFPQVWRGCSYNPSYSVTVRLYNPYPKSLESHITFIVEPLAKLLALIVPVSDSKSTFSYPLLCAVSCPGLFCINSGYISSLDIIKGGDSNAISFNQRPLMVDIKLTIGSLYNTLISHGFENTMKRSVFGFGQKSEIAIGDRFRPTFRDYIHQMETETGLLPKDGVKNIYVAIDEKEKELGISSAPKVATTTNAVELSRVPTGLQSIYDNL